MPERERETPSSSPARQQLPFEANGAAVSAGRPFLTALPVPEPPLPQPGVDVAAREAARPLALLQVPLPVACPGHKNGRQVSQRVGRGVSRSAAGVSRAGAARAPGPSPGRRRSHRCTRRRWRRGSARPPTAGPRRSRPRTRRPARRRREGPEEVSRAAFCGGGRGAQTTPAIRGDPGHPRRTVHVAVCSVGARAAWCARWCACCCVCGCVVCRGVVVRCARLCRRRPRRRAGRPPTCRPRRRRWRTSA